MGRNVLLQFFELIKPVLPQEAQQGVHLKKLATVLLCKRPFHEPNIDQIEAGSDLFVLTFVGRYTAFGGIRTHAPLLMRPLLF